MSEWRKISRSTPIPKNPAGEDAASAGGDAQAATPEACPVHSAASALFYLFTEPRSYHAIDYLIILHSAQLKHNWLGLQQKSALSAVAAAQGGCSSWPSIMYLE